MYLIRILVVAFIGWLSVGLAAASAVDVNNANAAAIAAGLQGVGTARATAIVDYRRKHGPFKTMDDLAAVKGIGPKVLEANKENIEFGEPKSKLKKVR